MAVVCVVVVVVSVVCTGAFGVVAGGGVSIVLVVETGGELDEQAARDKATTQRRGKGYCFIALMLLSQISGFGNSLV